MRYHLLVALAVSFALAGSAALADPPAKKPPKAGSSLDDELLKGLGDDPLLDLDKPKKPSGATKPDAENAGKPTPTSKPKPSSPLDDELLKGLGEPAEETDQDNPLVRITKKMREVEELIRQSKSGDATQERQQQIVKDLEKLIDQLEQQQQQQSSSSSSQQQQQQQAERDKVQQPGQKQPRPGQQQQAGESNKPAKDSTERQGKPEVHKPDMAQMRDLLKDIWGELPPRLRQQMMQSAVEKFLPKYELQIEEYFKTLSEEQGKK